MNENIQAVIAMYGTVIAASLILHGIFGLMWPGIISYISISLACLIIGPWLFLNIAEIFSGPEAFWAIGFFVVLIKTWYIPLLVGIPIHIIAFIRSKNDMKF